MLLANFFVTLKTAHCHLISIVEAAFSVEEYLKTFVKCSLVG